MPVLFQLLLLGLIAIALIAGLIIWLYPRTSSERIDRKEFKRAVEEHDLDVKLDEILRSPNGHAAIAKLRNDDRLAVLRRMGDGFAVRLFLAKDLRVHGSTLAFADFTWPGVQMKDKDANKILEWVRDRTETAHAP